MALLGDAAGLTGCIAGVAYKNISRNLRIKRNLDASAYLHGMDRPQATDEEMDIVRAQIAWDIKNRNGQICPLEMLDFFENGVCNKKEAIGYWSGCMFEQIFEDAGINTRKPIYITRGHDYMLDFQSKYSKELYYWQLSKTTGIRYKDIPLACPTCGYQIKDPAEDCPVCGHKAFIPGVKSYSKVMQEIKERQDKIFEKWEKDSKKAIRWYVAKKAIFWTILICGIYAFWIFCVRG